MMEMQTLIMLQNISNKRLHNKPQIPEIFDMKPNFSGTFGCVPFFKKIAKIIAIFFSFDTIYFVKKCEKKYNKINYSKSWMKTWKWQIFHTTHMMHIWEKHEKWYINPLSRSKLFICWDVTKIYKQCKKNYWLIHKKVL